MLAYVFLGLRDQDKVDEIAALPLAETPPPMTTDVANRPMGGPVR